MANPQKENGYTRLANELYEAIIRWHFSSYEYRVLIFIIRKTYGWNKKEDWISLSQFREATNIKESHVCRTINLLIKQNIITKGGNRDNPLYSIQKDYDKWIKLPKGVRSHHVKLPNGVIKNSKKGVIQHEKGGNSDVKRGEIQKKLITKETIIQKKEEIAGSKDPTPKEKAETFFNSIERVVKGEKIPEVTEFLTKLHSKHQNIGKGKLWIEVKDFCMYWTEKTSDGKRCRWQLQKTFEVERRLVTWLNKAFNGFSKNHYQDNKPKGKEIII